MDSARTPYTPSLCARLLQFVEERTCLTCGPYASREYQKKHSSIAGLESEAVARLGQTMTELRTHAVEAHAAGDIETYVATAQRMREIKIDLAHATARYRKQRSISDSYAISLQTDAATSRSIRHASKRLHKTVARDESSSDVYTDVADTLQDFESRVIARNDDHMAGVASHAVGSGTGGVDDMNAVLASLGLPALPKDAADHVVAMFSVPFPSVPTAAVPMESAPDYVDTDPVAHMA
jgi:hypothetical protein